jgi:hypothetical protein
MAQATGVRLIARKARSFSADCLAHDRGHWVPGSEVGLPTQLSAQARCVGRRAHLGEQPLRSAHLAFPTDLVAELAREVCAHFVGLGQITARPCPLQERHPLAAFQDRSIDLATMRNADDVDDNLGRMDLVHDSVVAQPKAVGVVAAAQAVCTERDGLNSQAVDGGFDAAANRRG